VRISTAALVVESLALLALLAADGLGLTGAQRVIALGAIGIAWLASGVGLIVASEAQGRGDERLPMIVPVLALQAIVPVGVTSIFAYLQAASPG
jgi:hypothetical protein